MQNGGLGWALWQTWLTYRDSWQSGCRPLHAWGPTQDGIKRCTRCKAVRRGQ